MSFYASGNLRDLPDSALKSIARQCAGESDSLSETAKEILRGRTPEVPDAALSPHEVELHRLAKRPVHRAGGFWRLGASTPSLPAGPVPSRAASTVPDRTLPNLEALSDEQLQSIATSGRPAQRTAAALCLNRRSRLKDAETHRL